MNLLSGSNTPLESMPAAAADGDGGLAFDPFRQLAQAILYRGAGLGVVWQHFLEVAVVGGIFFGPRAPALPQGQRRSRDLGDTRAVPRGL